MLRDRNIILGITGSIASYKSVDLARQLSSQGANVTVVMTESACRFIQPLTFETVLNKPVYTKLFDGYLRHISLIEESHLLIIAPATANTINKIACGIADNFLTTLYLAFNGPVLIAPAMNSRMYNHTAVKKSLRDLSAQGVNFIGPESGSLACGEEGTGRMTNVQDIVEAAKTMLSPKDLAGRNLLVTAGPTREQIDPIRYISNRSSGKMGFAIATAALRRGAKVTLISGPTFLTPPKGASFVQVESASEMENAVLKNMRKATTIIKAAAVSDFAPSGTSKTKTPKSGRVILDIKKTPDILHKLGRKKGKRVLVGFAAETGQNIRKAKKKLKDKNLDLIVMNDTTQPGAGFDVDTNIVTMIDRKGNSTAHPLMSKEDVANIILDQLVKLKP